MSFLNLDVIKRRKAFLLFLVVVPIIIASVLTIFYLDNFNPISTKNNSINLKEYNSFLTKVKNISANEKSVANNSDFLKLNQTLNNLSQSTSKEDLFNRLISASEYLFYAYVETRNHELYNLEVDLKRIIRINFPEKKYPDSPPACFDPTCASAPQPKEITDIINAIKSSSLPDYQKENDILNLNNFSYISDESSTLKANNFLILANDIKINEEYIKAGINLTIYNQIISFVKASYPKEYSEFEKNLEFIEKAKNDTQTNQQ